MSEFVILRICAGVDVLCEGGKSMVKVSCALEDYSDPRKPPIKVHNHWNTKKMVELEVDGKRYTVVGEDLITAIKNAMNTNSLC